MCTGAPAFLCFDFNACITSSSFLLLLCFLFCPSKFVSVHFSFAGTTASGVKRKAAKTPTPQGAGHAAALKHHHIPLFLNGMEGFFEQCQRYLLLPCTLSPLSLCPVTVSRAVLTVCYLSLQLSLLPSIRPTRSRPPGAACIQTKVYSHLLPDFGGGQL